MTGQQHLQVAPRVPATETSKPMFLLNMGDFSLLVPGADLVSLQTASNMVASESDLSCGQIQVEQKRWPVFGINKSLQLMAQLPADMAALAILQDGESGFALACCEINKWLEPLPKIHEVPISMSSRKQIFDHFAIIDRRAAGFSNARQLSALLKLRGASLAVDAASQHRGVSNG